MLAFSGLEEGRGEGADVISVWERGEGVSSGLHLGGYICCCACCCWSYCCCTGRRRRSCWVREIEHKLWELRQYKREDLHGGPFIYLFFGWLSILFFSFLRFLACLLNSLKRLILVSENLNGLGGAHLGTLVGGHTGTLVAYCSSSCSEVGCSSEVVVS